MVLLRSSESMEDLVDDCLAAQFEEAEEEDSYTPDESPSEHESDSEDEVNIEPSFDSRVY